MPIRKYQSREYIEQKAKALAARAGTSLPVDLFALAAHRCVKTVHLRRMIPEGVTHVVEDGFEIVLRDKRDESIRVRSDDPRRPSLTFRQRFTLAHELGHTFYYDISKGTPKPLEGLPAPDRLESLCDRAAAILLMPADSLRRDLTQRHVTLENLSWLRTRYGASAPAMILRLSDIHHGGPDDHALLYVRKDDDLIDAAFLPVPLLPVIGRPGRKPRVTIMEWAKPLVPETFWAAPSAEITTVCRGGTVRVAKVPSNRDQHFFVSIARVDTK